MKFERIFMDLMIIIFFILSVVFVFWYVFGNSPSFVEAVLVMVLGLLIVNTTKVSVLESRFNNLERSHLRLSNDFRGYVRKI
ncbi:MAG: hypothetical protein KJ592_00765 [Nanoarchaeota archaeon]|nr:hypothetical protein [Nanoarchaeota archaeon]